MPDAEVLAHDPERAQAVLEAIDNLLEWKRKTEQHMERGMARLAMLLLETKRGAYWTERGLQSEDDFIEVVFPGCRSQYYALLSIGKHLGHLPAETVEKIGRLKSEDLVRVKRHLGELPSNWVEDAINTPTTEFRLKVRKFVGDHANSNIAPDEAVEFMTFKLVGQQIDVVHRALNLYEQILGTDRNHGFTLEMLCADSLSNGYHESGDGYVGGKNWFILATCRSLLRQAEHTDDFQQKLLAMIAEIMEQPLPNSHPKAASEAALSKTPVGD